MRDRGGDREGRGRLQQGARERGGVRPGRQGRAEDGESRRRPAWLQVRPARDCLTPGEVDIKNSDDILHNIHTYSTANPSINKAQPKFKKVMTEKFEKPEIIKLTCDVHSWMTGWIAVMPNPFFVTDMSGNTKIDNVPPGKYTVEVWHETLGKQTKDVEVKAGQSAKVAFEMKK